MNIPKRLVFALCLFCDMYTLAYTQVKPSESRGELLYATHCNACHTSKIHWREKKLVTDWNSLKAQVRRWQASIGLDWSEEEITDVTDYLNAVNYGFPVTEQEGFLQGKKLNQVLRQY
jgi:mono/diheme cytochrome c family protein